MVFIPYFKSRPVGQRLANPPIYHIVVPIIMKWLPTVAVEHPVRASQNVAFRILYTRLPESCRAPINFSPAVNHYQQRQADRPGRYARWKHQVAHRYRLFDNF